MERIEAIEAALARTAAVLEEIGPDDLRRPTACADWDLGHLLGHVVGVTEAFAIVLEGGPTPALGRVDEADATPERLRAAADRVRVGWRADGALDREYDAVIELDEGVVIPPIPLPGSMVQSIHLLDVGVHVHDVAGAIWRPDLAADDEVALATLAAAEEILQPGIRELVGFGPERAAESDAPVERLLAFVGR